LDIDVFDDPTHGQQQLIFFHGYYKQYQYLVRAITCAENDLVVDGPTACIGRRILGQRDHVEQGGADVLGPRLWQ
jgi:hypothetical protein